MAFTIRRLSKEATENLDKLISLNLDLNTKSKAVEFVLENHFKSKESIRILSDENLKLETELETTKNKLNELLNALKTINSILK